MSSHLYQWSHQLHQAASEGNAEQLQQLLKEGCNPNNKGGVYCWLRGAYQHPTRTPLHYAAKEGHLECIRLLLMYGSNPNAKDEDGYTPLHYACQIFQPSPDRHVALSKCIESLVEFGANVRAETKSECTSSGLARIQRNDVCYNQVSKHRKQYNTHMHLQ